MPPTAGLLREQFTFNLSRYGGAVGDAREEELQERDGDEEPAAADDDGEDADDEATHEEQRCLARKQPGPRRCRQGPSRRPSARRSATSSSAMERARCSAATCAARAQVRAPPWPSAQRGASRLPRAPPGALLATTLGEGKLDAEEESGADGSRTHDLLNAIPSHPVAPVHGCARL